MTKYSRLEALDDPDKPHKSVWRCPTGVFVKLHCTKRDNGLGAVTFEIVPSACDETGAALRRPDGSISFLGGEQKKYRRLVKAVPDRVEDVEPLSVRINREMLFVIARVERAVLDERDAAAL